MEKSSYESVSDFFPWRRFFARGLDGVFYNLIAFIILIFLFNINLINFELEFKIVIYFVGVIFLFIFEPIFLSVFGTTFGKFFFGIFVRDNNGNKLSYKDARERMLSVFIKGNGLNIFPFILFRNYKSYQSYSKGEKLDWEINSKIYLKTEKLWCVAFSIFFVILYFFTLILSHKIVTNVPVNKGNITVNQFAENYNKYSRYYMGYDTLYWE